MISNFIFGCCNTDSYDQSNIELDMSRSNPIGVAGLFKNIKKPLKESQVSSYTEKRSIAKKLKQKKLQNINENNTTRLLLNDL